jgi:hypothetical protein
VSKPTPQVKAKYNRKVYTQILASIPKDLAERFKAKCLDVGVSQASVVKKGIEEFLKPSE